MNAPNIGSKPWWRDHRLLALVVIAVGLVVFAVGWGYRDWQLLLGVPPSRVIEEGPDGFVCENCNLLIISVDTLRADRLGSYGHHRPTSPNIDAIADRSVVFRDVLAQAPTTAPSHRSILSGRYVFQHRNDVSDVPLLAELLREQDYSTAAFVDGAQMSEAFGMSRGFESYFDTGGYHASGAQIGGGLAEINPVLIPWLEANADWPFFALVHTYDVHCPYTPPEPYRSMFTEAAFAPDFEVEGRCGIHYFNDLELQPRDFEHISSLYDGGVRYADAMLAEIFEALDRLDLYDDTLVVITSDHGEALGEGGIVGHNDVYDTHLKVPMILHLPTRRHVDIEGPVQLVDLMPTVLGMLQIEPPAGMAGVDLRPGIARAGVGRERLRYADNEDATRATVRVDQRWSLVVEGDVTEGLYDLEGDPEERTSLAAEHPERTGLMLEEYRRLRTTTEPVRVYPEGLDPEAIEQLRALGYLED